MIFLHLDKKEIAFYIEFEIGGLDLTIGQIKTTLWSNHEQKEAPSDNTSDNSMNKKIHDTSSCRRMYEYCFGKK